MRMGVVVVQYTRRSLSGSFVSIAAFLFSIYSIHGYYKSSFHAPLPHSQGESREPCWREIFSNSIARVFELFN